MKTIIILVILVISVSAYAQGYDSNLATKMRLCRAVASAADMGMLQRCAGMSKEQAKLMLTDRLYREIDKEHLSLQTENIAINIFMKGIDTAYANPHSVCKENAFKTTVFHRCVKKILAEE